MPKNNSSEDQLMTQVQFRYDLGSIIQTTAEIGSELALISDLDDLVETATLRLQQTLGYDQVSINLFDTGRRKFTLKIQAQSGQSEARQSYAPDGFSSLAHRAARRRTLICIGDLAVDAPSHYQPDLLNIRSELHIPLETSEDILGTLSLGSVEPFVFDQPDLVNVLHVLAAQLAVIIARAYRYHERLRQVADSSPEIFSQVVEMQHILPEIQSLSGGIQEVLDKIVRGVVEGLGYTAAMLAVLDDEQQRLSVQAIAYSNFIHYQNWDIVEKMIGIQIIGKSVSLIDHGDNLGVQTCLTGQTKISRNLHDLFHPIVDPALSQRIQDSTRIQTCVSIPLKVGHKVVGNLYTGTDKNEISESDLEALHFFVTNAAIAVQNSVHFEQVNQKLALREAELAQLRRIERMINSSLDVEEVLRHILNGALELTKADYGQVMLVGQYASGLMNCVVYPEALDPGLLHQPGLAEFFQENGRQALPSLSAVQELIIAANQSTMAGRYNDAQQEPAIRSLLGVPIALNARLVGIINIASQAAAAFDEQSLELLEQVAVQAGIAIRNAYQFKTEQIIRDRLANVSQVVAMGDMASNMVHSINNWVGAIRADTKYLMRQHEQRQLSQTEFSEIMADLLTNAEATLAMAENIKKPFQPSKQEPIDVNECILDVLNEKRPEMLNVIVIEDLNEVPLVMATRQLELVFENLLNNALQAMEGQVRGVLKFTTRLSKSGQWVNVGVQDTGTGLPDHLEPADIFKLGVSGKEGGMGYGLWWCDTFLKRWGGQIKFVGHSKRGCKFLVRLPVSSSEL